MRWYQGGIAEAVTASKKAGAIFVVYVEGKDTKSTEITQLIDSDEVSRQLESEHFVAIKVEENSVPHQQFSQIYKDVAVPSLFFIGKTGTPLEIIKEPQSISDLISKLKTILLNNGVEISAEHSNNFLQNERNQDKPEVVCDNDVCTVKPEASTSKIPENVENELKEVSSDDKVERAKELLNQKREAKKIEEEEKQKLKELERRKVGHDVQKLKRWQQENELKDLMDERNKEKKEQQEARQRVLAQIAQDKAERAARFAPASQQLPQISPQPTHRVIAKSNTARLQFKLPDGSSHMHEFTSDSTLQDVRNYIISNLNLPFSNFSLSTTFPRREFSTEECSATLLALELVPNAVILILPLHNGAVATNPDSWLMTLFWSIVGPILNIVGYVRSMIFGAPAPSPKSPTSQKKRSNENAGDPPIDAKRRLGEANIVRRHGNVHRLSDKTDSDDENNTWNGNSTQQM